MKIVSKRLRTPQPPSVSPEAAEVYESLIIIGDVHTVSPDDIKRAEQIFRDIRRQIEQNNLNAPTGLVLSVLQ